MSMTIPEWVQPSLGGAFVGAVVALGVAFGADLVVTTGSAERMAQEAADKAVITAQTPFCVAQFQKADAERRAAGLASMQAESPWDQGTYVADQGWATIPGTKKPDTDVAEACSRTILKLAKK